MRNALLLFMTVIVLFVSPNTVYAQRDRSGDARAVANSCLHPRDRGGDRCSYYRDCLEASISCEDTDFAYSLRYGEKYCNRFKNVRGKFSAEGKDWLDNTMACLQEAVNLWDGRNTSQSYYGQLPAGATPAPPLLICSNVRRVEFTTHPKCYLGGPSNFSKISHRSVCSLGFWDIVYVFQAAELQDSMSREGIEQALVVTSACVKYHTGRLASSPVGIAEANSSVLAFASNSEAQRLLDFWNWKQASYEAYKVNRQPPAAPASIAADIKTITPLDPIVVPPSPRMMDIQTIKFGTLNWVPDDMFSYVSWDGSIWTAQIDTSGKFYRIEYGTLNWIGPEQTIQIRNGKGQNALLEIFPFETWSGFDPRIQYIIDGTLNWVAGKRFEYTSWEIIGGETVYGRSTLETLRR